MVHIAAEAVYRARDLVVGIHVLALDWVVEAGVVVQLGIEYDERRGPGDGYCLICLAPNIVGNSSVGDAQ